MQPKVSVIVPIYNVEKYLPQCIESIINQTLKDIEIILVNDGSPDNSGKIVDKYEKLDSRIKVIHKENGGLSDARNYGMQSAIGEYISFIDSDDWIEWNMLENMCNVASVNNTDIVVAGKIIEYVNEGYSIKECFENSYMASKSIDVRNAIFHMCEMGLFNVVWNKIYKRRLLLENDFRFVLDAMPAEDIMFNSKVFSNIESLVVMSEAYYHYMKRERETYVTQYSPRMYNVFLNRYNNFKDLFNNLLLNEEKHMLWLEKVYIAGLNDCVINLYRKNSTLNSFQRRTFLKEKILSDNYAKSLIVEYVPQNLYEKIFKKLFVLNNPLIMQLIYDLLFFLRKNLAALYLKFRKKFSYGG